MANGSKEQGLPIEYLHGQTVMPIMAMGATRLGSQCMFVVGGATRLEDAAVKIAAQLSRAFEMVEVTPKAAEQIAIDATTIAIAVLARVAQTEAAAQKPQGEQPPASPILEP